MSILLIIAIIAGIVALVSFIGAAESYYHDEEFMAIAVGAVIVCVICLVFWWTKSDHPKDPPKEQVKVEQTVPKDTADHIKATEGMTPQQVDKYFYEITYQKFVDKFKLTAEQFDKIKGETKSQLVNRIRLYMETLEKKPEEQKPVVVIEEDPVPEEKTIEKVVEKINDPDFKYKTTW